MSSDELGILCATAVLSVSRWWFLPNEITLETLRRQRLHREEKLSVLNEIGVISGLYETKKL